MADDQIADWTIISPDSSLLIIENLNRVNKLSFIIRKKFKKNIYIYLQELSLLNPDEAIYIELGDSTEQPLPVAILSKAAIHKIAEGRGIDEQICEVSNG